MTHLLVDGSVFPCNGDSSRAENEAGDAHRLLLLDVGNVTHHDVHQRVLHQRQEHEHGAARKWTLWII